MQLNRGVQGPGDGSEHRYPEPFDPAVRTRTIPIFQWKYSRERALGTPQISPGRRFESFLCRSLCIFTGFAVCLEALWFLSPLPIPPGLRLRATQSASSLRVTELKRWCALSPPRSNLPPRPSNSQRAEFFLELFVALRTTNLRAHPRSLFPYRFAQRYTIVRRQDRSIYTGAFRGIFQYRFHGLSPVQACTVYRFFFIFYYKPFRIIKVWIAGIIVRVV